MSAKPHNAATAKKVANYVRLIDELTKREMLFDEICACLKYSPSGGRKYVRALRDALVIELVRYDGGTATYLGAAVYRAVADPEPARAFLRSIERPDAKQVTKKRKALTVREELAAVGRHVHILADDTHVAIRANRQPVMRDYMVIAFFGPAREQEVRA